MTAQLCHEERPRVFSLHSFICKFEKQALLVVWRRPTKKPRGPTFQQQ